LGSLVDDGVVVDPWQKQPPDSIEIEAADASTWRSCSDGTWPEARKKVYSDRARSPENEGDRTSQSMTLWSAAKQEASIVRARHVRESRHGKEGKGGHTCCAEAIGSNTSCK
jgi:hypothetical protein